MALRGRKKNKIWIWRAIDGVSRQTLGWVIGDRSDATLKQLLAKVDNGRCVFVCDDWEGFHRCISPHRLFTGKDLTFPIEQTNSDIRNRAARFTRRHKASSRSRQMVDLTLALIHHLQHPQHWQNLIRPLLSFFR